MIKAHQQLSTVILHFINLIVLIECIYIYVIVCVCV